MKENKDATGKPRRFALRNIVLWILIALFALVTIVVEEWARRQPDNFIEPTKPLSQSGTAPPRCGRRPQPERCG